MSELKKMLESVDVDTIKKIMNDNGATLYQEKKNELWYNTVCHGGDSHKLCYYMETKSFYCYTNCGSMSIITFIMKIRNCVARDAISYLSKMLGYKNTSRIGFSSQILTYNKETSDRAKKIAEQREKQEKKIKEKSSLLSEDKIPVIEDESILNYFEDVYYDGWIKDGISIPSMQKFGIKWYEAEKHIIIPHRNDKGQLVGIRRRSLNPEDSKNKYMPEIIEGVSYGHPLGLNIYGLYENAEKINNMKHRTCLIVEGEKSVMLADTYDIACPALATCGFNVTNWQCNKIGDLGMEEAIYIAFDKDFDIVGFEDKYKPDSIEYKATLEYINRINSLAKKLGQRTRIVRIIIDREGLLSLKDSPLDKGKDVFLELLDKSLINQILPKNYR